MDCDCKGGSRFLPVKSIMSQDVKTVGPETLILDALKILSDEQISGLPVVDDDKRLIGILTEKDVLKILTSAKITYEDTVAKYMTTKVVTFCPDDSVLLIAKFFQEKPIRRVPITDCGKVVGIVSRRDIIKLILQAKQDFDDFRFS